MLIIHETKQQMFLVSLFLYVCNCNVKCKIIYFQRYFTFGKKNLQDLHEVMLNFKLQFDTTS